jgi:hypothetical protein
VGPAAGAVAKNKKRLYRQYMNRKGTTCVVYISAITNRNPPTSRRHHICYQDLLVCADFFLVCFGFDDIQVGSTDRYRRWIDNKNKNARRVVYSAVPRTRTTIIFFGCRSICDGMLTLQRDTAGSDKPG